VPPLRASAKAQCLTDSSRKLGFLGDPTKRKNSSKNQRRPIRPAFRNRGRTDRKVDSKRCAFTPELFPRPPHQTQQPNSPIFVCAKLNTIPVTLGPARAGKKITRKKKVAPGPRNAPKRPRSLIPPSGRSNPFKPGAKSACTANAGCKKKTGRY